MNQVKTSTQQNFIKDLKETLAVNIENLNRTEDLGKSLNFPNSETIIHRINKIFSELSNCDIYQIPDKTIQMIQPRLNEYKQYIKEIREFKVDKPNTSMQESRINTINKINILYFNIFTVVSPIIPILKETKDIELKNLQMDSYLERIKEKINKIEETEKVFNAKLDAIKESAEEASAKIGVSKYKGIFLEQANYHSSNSKNWLIVFIMSILLTSIIGFILFSWMPYTFNDSSLAKIINFSLFKLVVFTMFTYFVYTCNKNYRAHRHGYIVNKHRQNALQTFETFVNSSEDKNIKDAILLQAAQTIFGNQKTGYITNEPEPQTNTTVLEIIKGVMGK